MCEVIQGFPSGWRMEAWKDGSEGLGFEEKMGFKRKLQSWDGIGAVPYGENVDKSGIGIPSYP